MPLKTGGGNHLQKYNQNDGQYISSNKAELCEKDKENLVLLHYFGVDSPNMTYHFPILGVHDEEYYSLFLRHIKYSNMLRASNIDINKCRWLLTYHENNDKSLFLAKIGYDFGDIEKLKSDIINFTDFNSLRLPVLTMYGLKCIAKTILNGYIVSTVWQIEDDLSIRLITLLPGGDKKW